MDPVRGSSLSKHILSYFFVSFVLFIQLLSSLCVLKFDIPCKGMVCALAKCKSEVHLFFKLLTKTTYLCCQTNAHWWLTVQRCYVHFWQNLDFDIPDVSPSIFPSLDIMWNFRKMTLLKKFIKLEWMLEGIMSIPLFSGLLLSYITFYTNSSVTKVLKYVIDKVIQRWLLTTLVANYVNKCSKLLQLDYLSVWFLQLIKLKEWQKHKKSKITILSQYCDGVWSLRMLCCNITCCLIVDLCLD